KVNMNLVIMTVIFLSVSFLISAVETEVKWIPFASLIAIMCMGIAVKRADSLMAVKLSTQFDKLWTVAEIFLFVLVGASVAIDHAREAGVKAIVLVLLVLLFRMLGVFICILGTKLSLKEKLFCMIAYTPKATVQAAIGGIPLALGLGCGEVVLTVSVVAILLTAPLGAFGIDLTYKKWLSKSGE
ncbi:MAG: cation:proton antiporter, partial [Lachnospiraceae bacterium]|nr:cation:proton antiporter [Lachnospiraceae bacterium]